MARTMAGQIRNEESLFACPHLDCRSRYPSFHDPLPNKNRFSINRSYLKANGEKVTSYKCRACSKYFTSTNNPQTAYHKYTAFPEKKFQLLNLYNGGLSQRYLSQVARLNKTRVSEALVKQGAMAKVFHLKALRHREDGPAIIIFDKDGKVIEKEWWVDDLLIPEDKGLAEF